ncbi:beta-lactamase [Xylariaceae sp. FL1019]|nr:beta-lactamase [Xylariaceae sp. FL1019]
MVSNAKVPGPEATGFLSYFFDLLTTNNLLSLGCSSTHASVINASSTISTTFKMATVTGKCDPRFEQVRSLLEKAIASGDELGASIAVNLDGEEVVDIWGGFVDRERTKPWAEDTIVNVWSSTKCLMSLTVLKLVEQGVLDLEERVSHYWPEFGANGKWDIRLRHILSYQDGLPGWDSPITQEQTLDLEASADKLAKQAPWWEPGTKAGYHPTTIGHLVGMIVRKATGRTLKEIVATEIIGPLGTDYQIGALEKDWPRVSPVYPPEDLGGDQLMEPGSISARTFLNPIPDGSFANTEAWKRAEMPATNGHTNARGMNRTMTAITSGGTVRGVQILKPETVELIFKEQYQGPDATVLAPIRYGIGYSLRGTTEGQTQSLIDPFVPVGKICYWGGWGGSINIMDLDRKLTITYAMNKMYGSVMGNKNTWAYVQAIYKALES